MGRRSVVGQMIRGIREGQLDPDELSRHDKKVIALTMRHETDTTQTKIAEFLHVSRRTIVSWCNELTKIAEKTFPPYETHKIARRFIARALEQMERARAKGDGWLEWQIEKDLLDRLGKMGLVYFKGDPINVIAGDFNETNITSVINAGSGNAAALNDIRSINAAIASTLGELAEIKAAMDSVGGGEVF